MSFRHLFFRWKKKRRKVVPYPKFSWYLKSENQMKPNG